MENKYDIIIIGAGIVGLATAYNIMEKFSDKKILMLEKEDGVAKHQTGRNSGVIHSGIYYKPNSLKAINCRLGKSSLEKFCEEYNVKFEICGKIIVATEEKELSQLNELYKKGLANGVNCRIIENDEIKYLEPHVNSIKGIHVPETGIVDYIGVCNKLAELIKNKGHNIHFLEQVINIETAISGQSIFIRTNKSKYQTTQLINCAGLYSDKVAEMAQEKINSKIIPFRGEYFEIKDEYKYLCKNLIYPVPNPEFPFLGIHFTRMINGSVECGPNAVLAFAREGYKNTDINFKELYESLSYKGTQKIMMKYWSTGLKEMWQSFSKKAFTKELQRLIPEVKEEYLIKAEAGIRAQCVTNKGALADDFIIMNSNKNIVNVLNAPSPAATASFNIGKEITKFIS